MPTKIKITKKKEGQDEGHLQEHKTIFFGKSPHLQTNNHLAP